LRKLKHQNLPVLENGFNFSSWFRIYTNSVQAAQKANRIYRKTYATVDIQPYISRFEQYLLPPQGSRQTFQYFVDKSRESKVQLVISRSFGLWKTPITYNLILYDKSKIAEKVTYFIPSYVLWGLLYRIYYFNLIN
jgi:hypothetical protein